MLAATTRGEPLDPVRHGAGLALGLWTLGFGAVLPAVGAHPPFGTWRKRREFVLPLSAHLAYGVGTVTVLKGLRSD